MDLIGVAITAWTQAKNAYMEIRAARIDNQNAAGNRLPKICQVVMY